MNHYATMAMKHWIQWLPDRFQAIPQADREAFFSDLGEQVALEIADLATELAGDDPPNEDYMQKMGRLNMAKLQAEDLVLRERVLLEPEAGLDEDDEEPLSNIGRANKIIAEMHAEFSAIRQEALEAGEEI